LIGRSFSLVHGDLEEETMEVGELRDLAMWEEVGAVLERANGGVAWCLFPALAR
jgi:hypothetical protein